MMVASSKRAGAATRWTRRPAALLVLCLSLCIFQAAAQRAVPPCAEVRPLYGEWAATAQHKCATVLSVPHAVQQNTASNEAVKCML